MITTLLFSNKLWLHRFETIFYESARLMPPSSTYSLSGPKIWWAFQSATWTNSLDLFINPSIKLHGCIHRLCQAHHPTLLLYYWCVTHLLFEACRLVGDIITARLWSSERSTHACKANGRPKLIYEPGRHQLVWCEIKVQRPCYYTRQNI